MARLKFLSLPVKPETKKALDKQRKKDSKTKKKETWDQYFKRVAGLP